MIGAAKDISLQGSYVADGESIKDGSSFTVSFSETDKVELADCAAAVNGYVLQSVTLADGTEAAAVVCSTGEDGTAEYEAVDEAGNRKAGLKDGDSVIFNYDRDSRKALRKSAGNETTSFRITKVMEVSRSAMRKSKSAVKTDGVSFQLDYVDESGQEKPVSSMSASGSMRKAMRKASVSSVSLQDVLENGGSYTWENLPKYDAEGNEIQYTAREIGAENIGYTPSYSAAVINGVQGMRISNTKNPEIRKVWLSEAAGPVEVELTVTTSSGKIVQTYELNAQNNWQCPIDVSYFIEEYTAGEAEASVSETPVPEGYRAEYTGDLKNGFTITNIPVVNIPVRKVWNEGANIQPVEIELLANGTETGMTLILDKNNAWKANFTADKYDSDGKEINYTVEELTDGYQTDINGDAENGFTITNSPETITIPVVKLWADGARGESVEVALMNGEEAVQTLTLDENNAWKANFTADKYDSDGNEINYTAAELTAGYKTDISGNMTDGFIITNSPSDEKVTIPVVKLWADGASGESVEVALMNGEETVQTLTLDENNAWKAYFTADKYDSDGNEINYTAAELTAGYKTDISGDMYEGFKVINAKQDTKEQAVDTGDKTDGKTASVSSAKNAEVKAVPAKTVQSSSAKTGDTARLGLYLVLAAAGAAVIAVLIRMARRKKDNT